MARLYIDENAGALLPGLRRNGHDVAFAKDIGTGRGDVWHLRRAIAERRVVISLDSGFYYLHGLWTALVQLEVARVGHSGILTAVQDREFSYAGWLDAIERLLAAGEELSQRILTWHANVSLWGEEVRPPWKGLI